MPSSDGASPRRGSGPDVVAHADWSTHPAKRWVALARQDGHRFVAAPPVPSPEPGALLAWLRAKAGGGRVLLGLDVPLGVPEAWGHRTGIASFRELLAVLQQDETRAASFFTPASRPEEITPWRPFYPARPGGARQRHLLDALGVSSMEALLRQCDRATDHRPAAGALFWTLGPKQPGKAAISAWRDVLLPALGDGKDGIGLWPFDGALAQLTACRVVVVEAYPADLGLQLGVPSPGRGWSKRRQADRRRIGATLARWSGQHGVALDDVLAAELADGFGEAATGEDRFDAVVGMLGMLAHLSSVRAGGGAVASAGGALEGWMFGMPWK